MIISHKYKFVIAAPVGLGAGPWLNRIRDEGDPGYLEIVGHPNGVCVPEGCETYLRFFCDDPYHRLPQLWHGRAGTPWEGPVQVRDSLQGWMEWYLFSMRRMYLEMGIESPPNGWGLRGEDGDWLYFDSPQVLRRTFEGKGVSLNGRDAAWGRAEAKVLRLQEPTRGWKEITGLIRRRHAGEKYLPVEAKQTHDLIRWHIPVTHDFYELPDELVSAFYKESARETLAKSPENL